MPQGTFLVIGLGNPGGRYASTRHNIGFMVVDQAAKDHHSEWKTGKGQWIETSWKFAGTTVIAIKPTTYMNDSGKAARAACALHGVTPNNCIIIVDEYNFPTGRIHLRSGGSDGGHNGLTSLIEELKTPQFWRLRCGISRDFGPGQLVDYVLGPFPAHEQERLGTMITNACEAVNRITKEGPQQAMQWVNNLGADTPAP